MSPIPTADEAQLDSHLTRLAPRRLLGVWAHPDDEAYLSAGLMHEVVRSGGQVTLVALTDGEAGFSADDARPADARRLQRRSELVAAGARVGVADIRHFGLDDGAVADADAGVVVERLVEVVDEIRPDAVVTFGPDGITGHDDHIACSALATRAWLARPTGELWFAAKTPAWLDRWRDVHERFGVWMAGEPRRTAVDELAWHQVLSGEALEAKRQVLAAHHSQTAPLAEALGEGAYRRWISQESFRWASRFELAAQALVETGVRP